VAHMGGSLRGSKNREISANYRHYARIWWPIPSCSSSTAGTSPAGRPGLALLVMGGGFRNLGIFASGCRLALHLAGDSAAHQFGYQTSDSARRFTHCWWVALLISVRLAQQPSRVRAPPGMDSSGEFDMNT